MSEQVANAFAEPALNGDVNEDAAHRAKRDDDWNDRPLRNVCQGSFDEKSVGDQRQGVRKIDGIRGIAKGKHDAPEKSAAWLQRQK